MSERVRALRGAINVDENDAGAILRATGELVSALMERNQLTPEDIVSCIFTCTDDLDAEFPAVAARRLGLNTVPLLCGREIDVPGAMPRVIRVLMHCYPPDGAAAQHVYLRDAAALREDLGAAQ
jgi:chorismate mutase